MDNNIQPKKIAMLTAGGLAPCLSSCVASLIETYTELCPETEIYCYLNGFRALPISDKIRITPEMARQAHKLHFVGGSPIGNSRVSLDNPEDCYQRNLVPRGENPWHVACDAIVRDGIEVIHTIGGDGTSVGASRLSKFSAERHSGYKLSVIGLPKTIDNDIFPIDPSLGAHTAAQEGAMFFRNVVGENSASNRTLLVHELMGRHCGYLAAETARVYREGLFNMADLTGKDLKRDIHALYIPEMDIDFDSEVSRLRQVMDDVGCVNIFVSEGAGLQMILEHIRASGSIVERDSSGNVKLSSINVGQWIADRFGELIGAEEALVQKSGYFCRAASADSFDRELIRKCCRVAVQEAVRGNSGIVGPNCLKEGAIELIPLSEIKGGRKFDVSQKWFVDLLNDIGQSQESEIEKECVVQQRVHRLRLPSKPRYRNISPSRKENLFVELSKKKKKQNYSNDTNFISDSVLSPFILPSSEMEEYVIKKIIKECNNFEKSERKALRNILINFLIFYKFIASNINRAGVMGEDIEKEAFKNLSSIAGNTISKGLLQIDQVKKIIIKSREALMCNENKNTETAFAVSCDPLDGASNLQANVSVGSVFGIFKHTSEDQEDLTSPKSLMASGYCYFGTAVVVVIAFRGKVVAFKLNHTQQKFELHNEDLKIPNSGPYYSANTGYSLEWNEASQKFLENCRKEKKSLRYVGSMVADIHRTLLYGGIFFYPANKLHPKGKLKLLTEAAPIAFIIENAGGESTDGFQPVSKVVPVCVEQTTPFFTGSRSAIQGINDLHKGQTSEC